MSGEDMTSSHTDLSVLSTEPIPYPLKCGPRIGMHLGDDFKTFMFVPTTSDECDTGFDWSDKDAVACKWQCTSKAAYITLTTFLDENIARQVGLPEPTGKSSWNTCTAFLCTIPSLCAQVRRFMAVSSLPVVS